MISLVILGAFSYIGYKYAYQDHRDIQSEDAVTRISAPELQALFASDPAHEYLNKTVTVSGVVTDIDSNLITLDSKVSCELIMPPKKDILQQEVKLKGRCLGYDELFEIVKLDQGGLLNQIP